jgi:hypothetical protein
MAKIKNWSPTKYRKTNYSIWKNDLLKYKSFNDNYYVVVGRIGRTSDFYMEVIKGGRQLRASEYDNFKDAKAQAMRYMRSHPNG